MRFWLIFTILFSFSKPIISPHHNIFAVETRTDNIKGIQGTINCLVVDSSYTVYAGTSNGVYKSTDGKSFNANPMLGTSGSVHSLAIDEKKNILYAGTSNGVYKSTDGNDFNPNPMIGLSKQTIFALALDTNHNIYAGTSKGVYQSTDGNDFNPNPMIGSNKDISSLATDSKGNVYSRSLYSLIYKSNGIDPFTPMTGTNGNIHSLATAGNGNAYAGTTESIYKSIDGNNFNPEPMTGVPKETIASLATDTNNIVYAGTRTGIYKSTDGNNFNPEPMKNQIGSITLLTTDLKDNVYAVNDNNKVYKIYEVTKPTTNLNGLSDTAIVTDVLQNDIDTFKIKLIDQLKRDQFSNLSLNDVDITKDDHTQLTENDINNNPNLIVKISAKKGNEEFSGHQIVSVNLTTLVKKIELSDLNSSIVIKDIHEKDVTTFKDNFFNNLKEASDSKFSQLSLEEVAITKDNDNPLTENDITTNPNLLVKITILHSEEFTGYKIVNVDLTTINKIDLNTLVNPTPINNIIDGDVNSFLISLVNQIKKQNNFSDLSLDDINITKADDAPLTENDITTNPSLTIKISAKDGDVKFINDKTLSVNLTTKRYNFLITAVARDGTLWVGKNFNDKTILFKLNSSTGNSLYEVEEFPNKTINSITVNNSGIVYLGTSTGLYQGNNNNSKFSKINNISDCVTALTTSANGVVWVGTSTTNATGKVYKGNESSFDEVSGTQGSVNTINTHNNDVWVGTTTGVNSGSLYKSTNDADFKNIKPDISSSVMSLAIENDGTLWIGTKTGFNTGNLYELKSDDTLTQIPNITNCVNALALESDDTLLIGLQTGFATGSLYELESNGSLNLVTGTEGAISSLTVDNKNQTIWIGTTTGDSSGDLYLATEINHVVNISGNIILVIGAVIGEIIIASAIVLLFVYLIKNKKIKWR